MKLIAFIRNNTFKATAFFTLVCWFGSGGAWASPPVNGEPPALPNEKQVILHTNLGDIVIELETEKAPFSVANFVGYAKNGHYAGTVFHRVIPGFMVQGGGFRADMSQKPGLAPIQNEADNGLKNLRGTVAMARTSDPHSASTQFFINLVDNDFLDHRDKSLRGWGYAVFGRVVEGMDVVDGIAKIPTGASPPFMSDVPQDTVEIISTELR